MAITFPTTLDTLTNPISTDPVTAPSHAGQHSDANDAIEALEAKMGVNDSTVDGTIDSFIRKAPVGTLSSNTVKGGVVKSIDDAVGNVDLTADGWIENEKY